MSRASDFRQKEVVNLNDGKRLGFVYDVEINMESGSVEAIIVPGTGKILGLFGHDSDYVIPWSSIKRVGEDIILVNMDV